MKHHLLKTTVILSILLTLCLPVSINAAIPDIGVCGVNLTWTLDNQGTLTISGSGEMYTYTNDTHAPWYDHRFEIQTVDIQPGVRNIGDWAFENCTNLIRVSMPDSVTRIGKYAFHLCTALSSINIPNSVTAIDDHTFFYCGALTDIVIPYGVTSIGQSAFSCTGLTHIAIPNSVTHIGGYAFSQCESLTSVAIPDSVTDMENHVFYLCSNLQTATIGKNVPFIEYSTFANCDKLETVAIPKSVTETQSAAFDGCPMLTTVKYEGTESEWNQIKIGDENDALKQAKVFYTVTQLDAATKTEQTGQTFTVTPMDIPRNSSIIFACYRDNQLVKLKPHTYTGEASISFTADTDYDEVKIMAWETLGALRALGVAEAIAAE